MPDRDQQDQTQTQQTDQTQTRRQDPAPAVAATPARAAAVDAATQQSAGPLPAAGAVDQAQQGTRRPSASDLAFGPEIGANDQEMGQHMVKAMDNANGAAPYDLHAGIHYSYNYKRECTQGGQPDLWKDDYRYGYNDSGHFEDPSQTKQFMTWTLKVGHSASEAVKAWLKGLTVAECNSSVIAMEMDTLRAAIGDSKFDKIAGSKDAKEDAAINPSDRLVITPGGGGLWERYMKQTDLAKKDQAGQKVSEDEMDKGLKPGEWYYFYNHPKYLLKHPGGAWQGENSLFMGKNDQGERIWSGLGASNVSEPDMFNEMVRAYNGGRDEEDTRAMTEEGITGADGKFVDKDYDPASGKFPDKVTVDMIKNDPPYTIGGTTRKGGFMLSAGTSLDATKVQATRGDGAGGGGGTSGGQ
jgi:hypothetical protein